MAYALKTFFEEMELSGDVAALLEKKCTGAGLEDGAT
jgi:hypothetical protein